MDTERPETWLSLWATDDTLQTSSTELGIQMVLSFVQDLHDSDPSQARYHFPQNTKFPV